MAAKKYLDSHTIVAEFLEARGFTIFGKSKKMKANGHDLMAAKGDDIVSVEVKRLRYTAGSYRIDLLPTQRSADVLAVVTDAGTVVTIPMSLVAHKKGRVVSFGSWIGEL